MVRPPRITVTRSAKRFTSLILWVTRITAAPWRANARTVSSRRSASPSVSTAVGSSRIRMRAPASSTLRISTRCCSATESDSVILRGSMLKPSSAALSLIRCSKAARRWRWLPEKA